jgi:ribosomal protein L11 methyltransferase
VGAPFDLICANILAGPLVRLAPALSRRAGCRARLILAGLLAEQEAWVMAAYRMQGFRLIGRVRLGVWTTLILARGRLRAGWPRSPVRPMLGVG